MRSFPKALFEFIATNEDAAGFFDLAKNTFFEEVLETYRLKAVKDISAILEEEFEVLFKCMVDYYCANDYPPPASSYFWNVVDAMLKEKKLSPSEVEFYNALRGSYGSLYKIHFDKVKGFLLENLIEQVPLFNVHDPKIDYQMVGRVIFAPPLKLEKQTILADGAFIFPEGLVDSTVAMIKDITGKMYHRFERLSLVEILCNGYQSREEMLAATKKVWAKDAVAEYTHYLLYKKVGQKSQRVMH